MNGFFQLQRRFFDHWLWTGEPRSFSKAEAFLDLLQLAAFKRTRKIVGSSFIDLEPGEVCGSERYLSGRWGWSTKKVRAFLTLLEADSMAARQKKQGVTVISLCNYRKYAGGIKAEEAAGNQQGSSEEAARKRKEEGEEVEPTHTHSSRAVRTPSIEDCEAVACERLPANKVWAASVARQFHAMFEVKEWQTSSGENLLHRSKWKARLLQMLEEEGRKTISKGGGKAAAGTPAQRHSNSYNESSHID